jgi:hypothetical protein
MLIKAEPRITLAFFNGGIAFPGFSFIKASHLEVARIAVETERHRQTRGQATQISPSFVVFEQPELDRDGVSKAVFFQTREDQIGLLQMIGPTDEPNRVRLRYKFLVPPGNANTNSLDSTRLAQEKLDRVRQLRLYGHATLNDVIEAEGDLALAEAGDDPVKRARAKADTAGKLLQTAEVLNANARVDGMERERALRRQAEAELDLQRALEARGQNAPPSVKPPASAASNTAPGITLSAVASPDSCPLTSSLTSSDNSTAAIAEAQRLGIAEATRDIQAGIRRILIYGLLTPEAGTERDEPTGYRLQRVAGSILSGTFQAEAAAYNYAMRGHWQMHDRWNPPGKTDEAAIPVSAR